MWFGLPVSMGNYEDFNQYKASRLIHKKPEIVSCDEIVFAKVVKPFV